MSLNDKIRNSDLGRSKNLMDYLNIKKFGGYDEREMARRINMDESKNLQARIDAGEFGGLDTMTDEVALTDKIKPSNLNNQEVAILKNSGPQLFYTKEGQRLILNLLKARADLDSQKLEAFNNFKNTGKLSYMGDDGEEKILLESRFILF